MYSLIRDLARRDVLIAEAPAFLISFLMAEAFYKFGSFSLELIAFLATWGFVGGLAHLLVGTLRKR